MKENGTYRILSDELKNKKGKCKRRKKEEITGKEGK